MLSSARVEGLVRVEEVPQPNHYHDGKIYNSVKVSSQRNSAGTKTDYLRLYFDASKFDKAIFTVGNIIKYQGKLIKSKITESLSDIAVSLDVASIATQEELDVIQELNSYVATGSVLMMQGQIIKINEETSSNDITSVSILVMSEGEDGRRVIAKLTGVGKIAEIIKTMQKDDMVNVTAKVYSYQIKQRLDLANYYLHDSRIVSIVKVGEANE